MESVSTSADGFFFIREKKWLRVLLLTHHWSLKDLVLLNKKKTVVFKLSRPLSVVSLSPCTSLYLPLTVRSQCRMDNVLQEWLQQCIGEQALPGLWKWGTSWSESSWTGWVVRSEGWWRESPPQVLGRHFQRVRWSSHRCLHW